MTPGPLTAELRATTPAIAARLGTILLALGALIARAFLKHPTNGPIILPLWNYLSRTVQRFTRVMRHVEVGTLRAITPRPRRRGAPARPPVRLPRRRAWLVAELKHEAVAYALHLQKLLDEPETASLVAALPQAQRLLRPICHLLGIQPACLARPPRPRAGKDRDDPRAAAEPRPRVVPRVRAPASDEALALHPRPPQPLCPRLLTRWPFAPHPALRKA